MQANALRDENDALRDQLQEQQAQAAALQDQTAEQSRTISIGNMQLKQLQSKVKHYSTCKLFLGMRGIAISFS